ncbi:hypothetical protein F4823DRAFT_602608 [Ustulina deusta]|nr:hypothetical protein F4823DRAFT_602608 [Ustulina deusta]
MSDVSAGPADEEGQDVPVTEGPHLSGGPADSQFPGDMQGRDLGHTYENEALLTLEEPKSDTAAATTTSSSNRDRVNNKNIANNPRSHQTDTRTPHTEGRITPTDQALDNLANIFYNEQSDEEQSETSGSGYGNLSHSPIDWAGISARIAPLGSSVAAADGYAGESSASEDRLTRARRVSIPTPPAIVPGTRRTGKKKHRLSPAATIKCVRWVDFASLERLGTIENYRYARHRSSDEGAPGKNTNRSHLKFEICAIDVLIGEPEITVGRAINAATGNRQSTSTVVWDMGDTKSEGKTTTDGLQFATRLPERVRFHSQTLIRALFDIIHPGFVTVVRPFRILLHKEEKIREDYRQLMLEAPMSAKRPLADRGEQQPLDSAHATITDLKPTELELIGCLVQLLDEYILPRVRFVKEPDCKRIYFDDLWHLFKPGGHVIRIINGVDIEVMRVVCVEGMEHKVVLRGNRPPQSQYSPFGIHCVAIDFDGKQLGPRKMHYVIDYFEGEKTVRSLPIMPVNRLKDEEIQKQLIQNGMDFTECRDDSQILQSLIERGKAFFNMTETMHMHFSGTTRFGEELDCPVMVDFEQAFASPEAQGGWADGNRYPGWKPDLESLVEWTPPEVANLGPCKHECCRSHNVYADHYLDRESSVAYLDSLSRGINAKVHSLAIHPRYRHEANTAENLIEDEEFLIMPWRVYGFVFQIRKFRPLSVSQVTPIRDSNSDSIDGSSRKCDREEIFDQLVLPQGHKEMIKSLIAQHFRDKQNAAGRGDLWDLVRGKGKGLVILLHGAPGVGKTTTAECIADYFRRPLFQLSCGDLGMWAEQVEKSLQETFALAGRWGCILLLDEADVFLSARTPTDLLRNSIVSVFLRVIEYYSGILFLTTNRVGDFDEAFASRIHMSLYYPPLDLDATISVFDLNMNRLERKFAGRGNIKLEIKRSSIIAYATTHWNSYPGARWNGRQIRNACQTALALAESEAQGGNHEAIMDPNAFVKLEDKHFKIVANSYLGFMNYLKDIYGVNLDERAKENFMRAGIRDTQATSPPNPLLMRKYNQEPPPRQTSDRYYRPWNPQNPPDQDIGINPPFQTQYSQPMEPVIQPNVTMSPVYPQSQAQMQRVPASDFARNTFGTNLHLQDPGYLGNIQGGFPITADQAQQRLQGQHRQQTRDLRMAPLQATSSDIQPRPLTPAQPSSQYLENPTASQFWTQHPNININQGGP